LQDTVRQTWPFGDDPSDSISIHEGVDTFLKQYDGALRYQQVAVAAYWFQAEVLNGGLAQFFMKDAGVLAPEAVAACLELGLPRLAGKLEEAMHWFGKPYPRDRGVRAEALSAFTAKHALETPYAELDEHVVELIYDDGPGLAQAATRFLTAT
jgi:Domain of unknown function (DUF4375)